MTTNIHLSAMTLYDWILILVLIFGGAGLVGKVLFCWQFSQMTKAEKAEIRKLMMFHQA